MKGQLKAVIQEFDKIETITNTETKSENFEEINNNLKSIKQRVSEIIMDPSDI
jgi:hypothetical protein